MSKPDPKELIKQIFKAIKDSDATDLEKEKQLASLNIIGAVTDAALNLVKNVNSGNQFDINSLASDIKAVRKAQIDAAIISDYPAGCFKYGGVVSNREYQAHKGEFVLNK